MLWGHTLRSPHAHARVLSIDLSDALTLPGVRAVLTHDDVPGQKTYGLEFADQPRAGDRPRPLFRRARRRRRRGASGAGAPGRRADRRRVRAARAVVDPERATESEPLHPDRPTAGHGYRDDPRPNVVRTMLISHGDPDAAGDFSVSGVYELGTQDQAFLGPESGLAVPDGEGGVDIYVATQWLHVDREQVAPCLACPRSRCGSTSPASAARSAAARTFDADPLRAARVAHEPSR
jgi:CO/xanthine dehydrogenase Mo-binding subunit